MMLGFASMSNIAFSPSKIEWDLTNGPLRKLLELLHRYSGLGVRAVGPVGDFLDSLFTLGQNIAAGWCKSTTPWQLNQLVTFGERVQLIAEERPYQPMSIPFDSQHHFLGGWIVPANRANH